MVDQHAADERRLLELLQDNLIDYLATQRLDPPRKLGLTRGEWALFEDERVRSCVRVFICSCLRIFACLLRLFVPSLFY
jgi:hypothetical protein